ncbi:DnaD domain protein [Geobacillus sp. 46C-IIa]|uniref:DnaD domain protein n=1 Tax=Geobacillus sp. 46C-IIa TaxID=1963025 RepID=UPI0009BF665D|nr:DnaD domain protein [Geobacillus sp. 46C-IIa]OQP07586.1 DNA replication protein DnaD [Geobacillus sp. 46C-IIa]QNU28254.1 DnaD domain protein [Geobacillus sp. 46C-IIa]
MLTGHPIVDKVAKINLAGTVIPHNWFSTITFENGKPDTIAIVLLSEIVYWYRPMFIKDEATGRIKEVRKRFKADLLQRSYDSFAEQFGFTKRQVRDAIKRLEDKGLIRREFRNIHVDGMTLTNVLFIELNPEKLSEFTYGIEDMTTDEIGSDVSTDRVLRSNVTPYTIERQTNTEITTKTTTNIDDDDKDEPINEISREEKTECNPVTEFEKAFGYLPPSILQQEFEQVIENGQFKKPEAIIVEAIRLARKQMPRNPARYISSILRNFEFMGLFTLDDVKEYNEMFEQKRKQAKRRRQSPTEINWDEL